MRMIDAQHNLVTMVQNADSRTKCNTNS